MCSTRLYITLSVLLITHLARTGHADTWDARGHSGALCHAVPSHAVVCPVVRDSPYAPQTPFDVSVTVQSSGEGRVRCTLYSLGSTGNLIGAFSRTTDSEPPSTLFFSVPPQYVGFAGSAHILCTLPPGGAVLNYYAGVVVETDGHQ
jgi:hypothetical protein